MREERWRYACASDWGGLGYGYGYAFARDNLCTLAQDVVESTGQLSRFFGPGGGNLQSDFVWALFNSDAEAEANFAKLDGDMQELLPTPLVSEPLARCARQIAERAPQRFLEALGDVRRNPPEIGEMVAADFEGSLADQRELLVLGEGHGESGERAICFGRIKL